MAIIKNLGKRKYELQNEFTFNRIKRPPINAPSVSYTRDDTSPNVDLSTINPQFKYNYVYINEEESVYSPSSRIIPKNIYNFALDAEKTIPFSTYEIYYNSVGITLNLDDDLEDIYKINLVYRDSDYSDWRLLKIFDKQEIEAAGDTIMYTFNGSNKLIPISQDKVNKSYDFTPERANDLVLSENRLFDAGVTEGKDILSDSDIEISITESNLNLNLADQVPVDFNYYLTESATSVLTSAVYGHRVIFDREDATDVARLQNSDIGFGDYNLGENFVYSRGMASFDLKKNEMVAVKHKINIVDISTVKFIDINFNTRLGFEQFDGGTDRNINVEFYFQWNRNPELNFEQNQQDLIDELESSFEDYHLRLNSVVAEYSEIPDGWAFTTDTDASSFPQLYGFDSSTDINRLTVTSYYETHLNAFQANSLMYFYIIPDSKPIEVISSSITNDITISSDSNDNFYYVKDGNYILIEGLNIEVSGGVYSTAMRFSLKDTPNMFLLLSNGSLPEVLSWKNGFNVNFGIRYFDDYGVYSFDLSKSSGMSITPVTAELNTFGKSSCIKYEIRHIAPSWAKYYAMTIAKREPQFEYYYIRLTSDNTSPTDTLYEDYIHYYTEDSIVKVKIYANYIGDDLPNLQSPTWDFQKGDRIRISRIKSDNGSVAYMNGDDYYKYDYQISSIQDETFLDGTTEATYTILTFNANSSSNNEVSLTSLLDDNLSSGTYVVSIVFELYRPQDNTDDVLFYECTSRFPVSNGYHSSGYDNSGLFRIDNGQTATRPAYGYMEKANSWIRLRAVGASEGNAGITPNYSGGLLATESRYVSDHNLSWDTGFDKVGLVSNEYSNRSKEYEKIRWSDVYIRDLNINGLSSNSANNYVNLSPQYGRLQAIESFGDTIVAFQDRKVTSYYIGRKQITDTEGNTQLITTDDVISVPNKKIDDYGTVFKDSVVKNNRRIYFFDVYNKCMCMYSVNGISNISSGEDIQSTEYNFKMGKYFRDKSNDILSLGVDKVNVSCVYSELDEILFVTFYSSQNSTINETIGFHEPSGKWVSFYSFTPEKYGKYAELFCSFKDGQLYKHRTGDMIYGEDIESEFDFIVNENANKKKLFDYIRLHSNKPIHTEISTSKSATYPNGQFTRIYDGNYELYEGQYEADIKSNMLDSSGNENIELLYDGDRIRDYAIKVKLSGSDIEIFGVDIGMTYS